MDLGIAADYNRPVKSVKIEISMTLPRSGSSATIRTARQAGAVDPTRRSFLRFLLSSPLLLSADGVSAAERFAEDPNFPAAARELIRDASRAINVFDFQPVARRNLSEGHYAFLSAGVDHEVTLRANRRGFDKIGLRPRRLVDVRRVDSDLVLLGAKLSSPILLAPIGSQGAFHAEGELPVARAAREKDHQLILSTGATRSIHDVARARGTPLWYQLYTPRIRPVTSWQLDQAADAGCSAVVLTVDMTGLGGNRDRINRFHREHNPACESCHGANPIARGFGAAARLVGIDPLEIQARYATLDWETVDRIRDATSMKLLIKGILTREDAELCVRRGVDGIVVSNHGGRAEDTGISTIEVLPEITDAVAGRIPVLIDSGFRRGSDVFKALALGASAVCIGRPYVWGLAAFGQEGVESVLALLRAELRTIMRHMGTPSLSAISASHVQRL
jgi:4-hydroxymandelate oxidase